MREHWFDRWVRQDSERYEAWVRDRIRHAGRRLVALEAERQARLSREFGLAVAQRERRARRAAAAVQSGGSQGRQA